jgi:hypothetical protein
MPIIVPDFVPSPGGSSTGGSITALQSLASITSNLFVRLAIDEYATTPGGPYTENILRFSDKNTAVTIDNEEYLGLGRLMAITGSNSELRVSGGELTITITGIPNTSIAEIVNSKIKGSAVSVYRVLFDPVTDQPLDNVGNPLGRFNGFVNNYSLNEDYDVDARLSSNTIVLTCSSVVEVLNNKIAGRKTNPQSFKRSSTIGNDDKSMDRVPTLKNATFNFGAP